MKPTAAYRVYRETCDTDQPHSCYTVEITRPDTQQPQRIAESATRAGALLAANLFCNLNGWQLGKSEEWPLC